MGNASAARTSLRALAALLLANLLASILHFGDNMAHFHHYPEPGWIPNPRVVDGLWLLITPLLVLGWWLARRGMRRRAIAALWLYGCLSMMALGHYLYGSPWDLSFRINFLIGLEAAAALVLILSAPFVIPP